jgi:putative ABC transport system permease protein
MFKNYLYTALRNFSKNKSYIIINTFGLGIALACCISAYIILAFNIEFDSTFDTEKLKNTYRIHTLFNQPEGGTGQHVMGPINLASALAADIPGIEMYSRFNYASGFVRIGENSFSENVAFADSAFFEMFDYELIKGNSASFNNINSIAISEDMADKFFPQSKRHW